MDPTIFDRIEAVFYAKFRAERQRDELEFALRDWLAHEDAWNCDRESDDRVEAAKAHARAILAKTTKEQADV